MCRTALLAGESSRASCARYIDGARSPRAFPIRHCDASRSRRSSASMEISRARPPSPRWSPRASRPAGRERAGRLPSDLRLPRPALRATQPRPRRQRVSPARGADRGHHPRRAPPRLLRPPPARRGRRLPESTRRRRSHCALSAALAVLDRRRRWVAPPSGSLSTRASTTATPTAPTSRSSGGRRKQPTPTRDCARGRRRPAPDPRWRYSR